LDAPAVAAVAGVVREPVDRGMRSPDGRGGAADPGRGRAARAVLGDPVVSLRASGTFEVRSQPQPPYDAEEGVSLGRVSITKRFQGDLEGTSTVEMIG